MAVPHHRHWCTGLLLAQLAFFSPFARGSDSGDFSGIAGFHKVDEHVYRGAQPNEEGFRSLARRGIKTVLDLRSRSEGDAEREKQAVEALGMRFVHVPMRNHESPSDAEISRALSVLNDPAAWPVFVHCDGGHDRTGTVVACYRIGHDKWSGRKALDEAVRNGMRHHERKEQDYILSYRPPTQARTK